MTSPGPRPAPKNIRDIRSARRPATAVSPDAEIDLPIRIPAPPDHLTEEELDVFVTTARKLAGMRVMTDADVEALCIYCRNWVIALDAHRKSAANPIVKTKAGNPIQNPYFAIARKAEDRCLKILGEFGLTPSSRVRVGKLP